MPKILTPEALASYERNGFHFPIRVMSGAEAASYRARLENYEAASRGPISSEIKYKVNLLFTWANELVRNATVLDAVEDIIGPDILCWGAGFLIKEPGSADYVSFHQDATYWGLSPPDVVTSWLALSPVTLETGPMQFLPRSHTMRQVAHHDTYADDNMLTRGQEIEVDVDEADTVPVLLEPGEISLHHVLLVHGSGPNTSGNRRIGLAVRYVPTHVRQEKLRDSATLVRGVDDYGYFDLEPEPAADLDAEAQAAHAEALQRLAAAVYSGTDRTEME